MHTHISLGFLASRPRAAARALALIDRGMQSYRLGDCAEAAVALARLLLFYPVGHPARIELVSALETLRSGRAS